MTDFKLKFFVLMGLITFISALGTLAIYFRERKRSRFPSQSQSWEPEDDKREVLEGCIVEYSYFFLKADSDGFVNTPDGGLSIEYFCDKDVEIYDQDEAEEETPPDPFVKTSVGPIHKRHIIRKGA